ncbi:unnamed protein product [Callosobruchus maculatus]|uniref:Uncharacterized protein n=1 Tax=Callosobruchus maculatus TaxID=64391 RepID=A0A653DJ22_CALMS|nr:unnamed protein product [Callosobruchus maculatus]
MEGQDPIEQCDLALLASPIHKKRTDASLPVCIAAGGRHT